MIPEEEAENIMAYFIVGTLKVGTLTNKQAKQCSLIAVDRIIDSYSKYTGMHDQEFFDSEIFYWQHVKEAINNL